MKELRVLLHAGTIVLFCFGMLYFKLIHDFFDHNPYSYANNTYYIWDKTCYALLALCYLFPVKEMRPLFKILVSFACFRLLWEIPEVRDWKWAEDNHVMLLITISHIAMIGVVWIIEFLKYDECRYVKRKEKELFPPKFETN